MLTNEVVLAIILLLALSLGRVNVIVALIISAMFAGLWSGLGWNKTVETFTGGLGGGASVAMNYAVLGAFAVAIAPGITELLAYKVISLMGATPTLRTINRFKYVLLAILLAFSISSQNLIPVHIAFIPIIVPPLLGIFNKMQLDRRAVACVLTFGLTATYMILPVGFGKIFIENILVKNINEAGAAYNFHITVGDISLAMLIPVLGMVLGLAFAVFVSYRKPRQYVELDHEPDSSALEARIAQIKSKQIWSAVIAVFATFGIQLFTNSTIIGGVVGLFIFWCGGVFKLAESTDIFQRGLRLMAMIGFVMIAASGFAAVINETGGVHTLVQNFSEVIGTSHRALAALVMLVIGLFITMGIGSSFSTVPIIASIYIPICVTFGFSPLATCAIVGVSAALGDAGSPASDSTLGPTSGLNLDEKHDHIWDSVIPTFLHFNIPLLAAGWVAAMVL